MNPTLGWILVLAAHSIGYAVWGWRGVALALSASVFWALLQLSRAMRVMRTAARAPVGRVRSAVMLNARLHAGLRLIDIVPMTGSLGQKVRDEPETWRWRDDGGASVTLELRRARLARWWLERPADATPQGTGAHDAAPGASAPPAATSGQT